MKPHRPAGTPPLFPLLLFCATGALLFCLSTHTQAASIRYPGHPLTPDPVAAGPADSLFISGSSSGNTVTVDGGVVPGNVYGGAAFGAGDARNNSVVINGGTIGVLPSVGNGNVAGGYAVFGSAVGNSVIINDGLILGTVFGGYSGGYNDAAKNTVVINGGTIEQVVTGGYAYSGGNAVGNSLTVTGGILRVDAIGGVSLLGEAAGNSVRVTGGTLDGDIRGGDANGNALGNSVFIGGGLISGDVYGGHSFNGMAVNNTVTLFGAPSLAGSSLFGGFSGGVGQDDFSGNRLNVFGFQSSVADVENFAHYNFVLPAGFRGGDTLLTVTGTATLVDDQSAPTAWSTFEAHIAGGGAPLKPGDTAVLLSAATLHTGGSALTSTTRGRKGISLLYDFSITANESTDRITATVLASRLNPRVKALSEGRLAGLAFANRGADLIAGQGLTAAQEAGTGRNAFAVVDGSWSRLHTGSHIDLVGASLLTGLAWNTQADSGASTFGVFFEAGRGTYDSYNSFAGFASVNGDGDTSYYGGGFLGRFDFASGPYVEVSARLGRVDTDFDSGDLRDGMGNGASYDSGSLYYGAHTGLGYILKPFDGAALDLSVKYLWTRQEDDTVTVAGDPFHFDAVDSRRLRGGARLSHAMSPACVPYLGAAYEHEFDAEAGADVYGYDIEAPDMRGGTGIGEVGLTFKPTEGSAFSADLGMQGYAGTREGAGGTLRLRWDF